MEKIVQEEQKKLDIKQNIKENVDMSLLNEIEEEALRIILDTTNKNDHTAVGSYDLFPNYIYDQLKDIMYKLKIVGCIARGDVWLNGWSAIITPLGLSYFEKKGMREELFNELSDKAKELLKELVDNEFGEKGIDEILREKLENDKTDRIIRGIIGTLKTNGLISVSWVDDTVYYAELTDAGRTYFEREKKYMDKLKQMSGNTYNINNSGIFNMGNIENLNINIDNSIREIEKKIENNDSEDKEELKEILQEVKDYIDNIKETKTIGKNGGLFKRVSNHLSKHRMVLCRNSITTWASLFNDNGRTNEMNLELVKDIYNLHIKGFEGLDFNVMRKNNYEITYNPNIKDCYSNFVSNFDVNNKQELKNIIEEANAIFNKIDRKTVVYLIPFMKELYNNKENYFENKEFELISTESWQIYDDFSKVDEINTNCKLNIQLELANNMKEYADYVMSCYQTDSEDDPYGDLDDGYRQGYINYKKIYDDINSEFYYIKVDNKIVGTTQSVYNDNIYGIYSLAINKDYRNKGIGKEVLKQQLQMCKSKKINIAYLQTEVGFYPNEMYRKFGFKDLCIVYYYLKKEC